MRGFDYGVGIREKIRLGLARWLAPELAEIEDRYERLIWRMQDDIGAFRERLRRRALENSPAGLADAHSKSPSRPAMPKEEDSRG